MTAPGDFALQVESAPAEYRQGLHRIFRGQWIGFRLHFFAIQCILAGSIVIALALLPGLAKQAAAGPGNPPARRRGLAPPQVNPAPVNPNPNVANPPARGWFAPANRWQVGIVIWTAGVIFAVASKLRLLTDYNHAISPVHLRRAFLLHVISQGIRFLDGGGFISMVSMLLYVAGTFSFLLYLRDVAVHLRRTTLEGMAWAAIITFTLLVAFSVTTMFFVLALARQAPIGILAGPSMLAASLMGVAFWLCYSRIVWGLGSSYADLMRRARPDSTAIATSAGSATEHAAQPHRSDDVFQPF
jgi:hypothetical protein